MPMPPTQNDAEAGAAAAGGRRSWWHPASASPELSARPRVDLLGIAMAPNGDGL
jgi:hypothetical protein